MLIVQIQYTIKADQVEAFKAATLENARNTIHEAGNQRFEFYQVADSPNQFLLFEIYDSEAAQQAHLGSDHFKAWREAVTDLIEERRLIQLTKVE